MDEKFRQLLQRVQEGSEEAAWELVDQYGDSIRRAVRRSLHYKLRSKFDSLDFVQLVWGSVFRAPTFLDQLDRPEALVAYLVAMAQKKVGMEVRRRLHSERYNINREEPLDRTGSPEDAECADEQLQPIDIAIAREQWSRLLQSLPARLQQIIRLRTQGHTCQEIAGELDVDESTVRRSLKRFEHDTTGE